MPNHKPFFKTTFLGENVINLWPFLGYCLKGPTKSSLIGDKSPNLVTLARGYKDLKSFIKLSPEQRLGRLRLPVPVVDDGPLRVGNHRGPQNFVGAPVAAKVLLPGVNLIKNFLRP
jgi:hypothetical protein